MKLFESLYALPFYELMYYKKAIFVYKVYHEIFLITILMSFKQNYSNYLTIQSNIFFVIQDHIRSRGASYML